MKKAFLFSLIILFYISMGIFLFLQYKTEHFKLAHFPIEEGKFLATATREDSPYQMDFYLIDGGSLSADSVGGILRDTREHSQQNIFLAYPCYQVRVQWNSHDHIIIFWQDAHTDIQRSVTLNLARDHYDWREDKYFSSPQYLTDKSSL